MKIICPETTYYSIPTEIYFGRNILRELSLFIKDKNIKKILFVSGEHLKQSNQLKNLMEYFKECRVDVYDQEIKVSDFLTINKLSRYCKKNTFDCIIAVGGGTILDTAKCASILAKHEGIVEDYVLSKAKKIKTKGLFYIAIPTTAGTGSEVTPWASIWGEDKKKYSLFSKTFMFPDIAIIDSALTDTLSPKVTAESGIDALCQAIESYWNVSHNKISDVYALHAIKVIIKSLDSAVNNPNPKIREAMAWGSLCGGLAFSNTKTTICHAISYPLTAHWRIPHGQATSLTLPIFIQKIIPLMTKARQKRLLSALESENAPEAAIKITQLMKGIGLKIHFSDLGLEKKDIQQVVKESFYTDRMNNIPLIYTEDTLTELLFSLY